VPSLQASPGLPRPKGPDLFATVRAELCQMAVVLRRQTRLVRTPRSFLRLAARLAERAESVNQGLPEDAPDERGRKDGLPRAVPTLGADAQAETEVGAHGRAQAQRLGSRDSRGSRREGHGFRRIVQSPTWGPRRHSRRTG
jgi:hypothetical protein